MWPPDPRVQRTRTLTIARALVPFGHSLARHPSGGSLALRVSP